MTITGTEPATVHRTDVRYIVAAVDRTGSHFFSGSTMRFFRSRVMSDGWRVSAAGDPAVTVGYVCVTSETDAWGADRAYTVRVWVVDGGQLRRLDYGRGFRGYGSRSGALSAAARAARDLAAGVIGG